MVKSKEDTIAGFNEQVNMTVGEPEPWLASDKSHEAGTGVGLQSGKKIVEILKKNPDKDPSAYEQKDLDHMHKVVGYINRHLAQEGHLKETKTKQELANTKSTISLKNWGHDPIKSMNEERESVQNDLTSSEDEKTSGSSAKSKRKREESEDSKASTIKKRRKDNHAKTIDNDGSSDHVITFNSGTKPVQPKPRKKDSKCVQRMGTRKSPRRKTDRPDGKTR
ncbi:hypothetical protein BJ138DRAFT_1141177 [Hygrophoropsis aurantiaca]|uniref:Uncharacterized protein n=1 Tax=Hygrophoropsis aurantiaca TaxID=72124 RepID=A0ACB8ARU1_9AGAM|nr:hypothetical protein BJ138DRAFT_1141177 [Hygrophoropsis aurantiaca]